MVKELNHQVNSIITKSKAFSNPYLLLNLTTLFWAGNAVVGKLAVGEFSAVELTFYRWLLASVLLLPFAWKHLKHDWVEIKRKWVLLFLLGTIGFTCFNLSLYWALKYTSVVNVVIEQAAIPAVIILVNFIIFRLPVNFLQIVGLVLVLTGVVLTVTKGDVLLLVENGVNIGDAIMLIAVLSYSIYSIALKWRPQIHWLSFLFCLTLFASITSAVFYVPFVVKTGVALPGFQGVLLVLYLGVFPSIFAQLFYARGVEIIGANRAGMFISLVPVYGAVLAIILLGEDFHWYHLSGMVLVVGGIFIAEKIPQGIR